MPDSLRRKITVPKLQQMKRSKERIVCLTAYDYIGGVIAERAEVDVVLVGDSLGNVVQGQDTVLDVSVEDISYHIRMVKRGLSTPLLVGDMPFGSYGGSISQAFESATQLMKAGAESIKLEGPYYEEISALWKAGIPVMGHLGFTPQSIHRYGGYKIQGKKEAGNSIIEAAKRLEDAGAFAIVLELIPADLAKIITEEVSSPTIGIGAGIHCDGEIQVFHDVFGLTDLKLKHAKRFAEGLELFTGAAKEYTKEVRERTFPGPEQSS
jgi:3-methyl-2-oxobutanoate hydroxymethyltransferase